MGLFRRLLLNAGAVYAGQVAEMILQLAIVAFILKKMTVAMYGAALLVISIDQMLDIIRGGMGNASVKYFAEALAKGDRSAMEEAFATSVALQVAVGCAGALLCLPLALHVSDVFAIPSEMTAEAAQGILIIGASLPLTFFLVPWQNLLMAHERYDLFALARMGGRLLRALLIFALLTFRPAGLLWVVVAVVSGNILQRGICLFLVKRLHLHIPLHFKRVNRRWVHRLAGYTVYDTLHVLASILYQQGALFIATHYISLSAVAAIGIVRNITQLMDLAVTRMTQILVPTMSRLAASGDAGNMTRLLRSATTLSVFVGGGLVCALVPFMESLFRLWLGESYVLLAPIAILLLVGQFLSSSVATLYASLSGMGRMAANGLSNLGSTLLGLMAGAWLVIQGGSGLMGLCQGLFLARFLHFAAMSHYGSSVFHLDFPKFFWHSFGKTYLICLGVTWLIMRLAWSPATWPMLFLGGACAGALFLILGAVPVISREDRRLFIDLLFA